MDAENWTMPRRPDAEWEPFMSSLRGKMRAQRRWRGASRVAAAASLILALWAGIQIGGGADRQTLRAEIPTTASPIFQPARTGDASQAPVILICMDSR